MRASWVRWWRPLAAVNDVVLAGAMLVVGEAMVVSRSYGSGDPWVIGVGVAALSALLVLRTRDPMTMCAGISLVWVTLAVLGAPQSSIWALVLILVAAYTAGAQLLRRPSLVALALLLGATYASTWLTPDAPLGDRLFTAPVLVGGPWLAGTLARRFREQALLLAVLNWELDERRSEDVRLATQLERSRIARELHDVVSHGLGLILVQAAAARRVLEADPGAAVEPLDQIRDTGKHALADMRRMLGLLRDPADPGAPPEAGVEHLDRLVDRLAAAGVDVRVTKQGEPFALSAEHDLTTYRVIQEAVTNAVRHAQAREVRVALCHEGDRLVVTVENDVAATVAAAGNDVGTSGGLRGMRERASLVGGRIEAGPVDRRWRVRFELPADGTAGA